MPIAWTEVSRTAKRPKEKAENIAGYGAHREPLGEGVRHVGMNDHLIEEADEALRRLAQAEVLDDHAADVELGARHVHDDVVVGGIGEAVAPHHVADAVHVRFRVVDMDEGAEVGVAALDAGDRHVDQAVGRRRLPSGSGRRRSSRSCRQRSRRCGSSRRRPCWSRLRGSGRGRPTLCRPSRRPIFERRAIGLHYRRERLLVVEREADEGGDGQDPRIRCPTSRNFMNPASSDAAVGGDRTDLEAVRPLDIAGDRQGGERDAGPGGGRRSGSARIARSVRRAVSLAGS